MAAISEEEIRRKIRPGGNIQAQDLQNILVGLFHMAKTGEGGKQGPQGLRGATGANGANGTNGQQGKQGRQGPKGSDGVNGSQGKQGKDGPSGANGSQGKEGKQGKQGPQGAKGVDGTNGKQGNQGPQGLEGKQGIKGDQGERGYQGTQGPEGVGASNMKAKVIPMGQNLSKDGEVIAEASDTIYDALQAVLSRAGNGGGGSSDGTVIPGSGSQGRQGRQGSKGDSGERGAQGTQGPAGDLIINGENIGDRLTNIENRLEMLEDYARLTLIIGFQKNQVGKKMPISLYGYYSSEPYDTGYVFHTASTISDHEFYTTLGPIFYGESAAPVVIINQKMQEVVNKGTTYSCTVYIKKGEPTRIIVMCDGYETVDTTVTVYNDETKSYTMSWATEGSWRFQVLPNEPVDEVKIIDRIDGRGTLFEKDNRPYNNGSPIGKHTNIIVAANKETGLYATSEYNIWQPDHARRIGRIQYTKAISNYGKNSTARLVEYIITSAYLYSNVIVPINVNMQGTYDTYKATIRSIVPERATVTYRRDWHEGKNEWKPCHVGDVIEMYTWGEMLHIHLECPYSLSAETNYMTTEITYGFSGDRQLDIEGAVYDCLPYFIGIPEGFTDGTFSFSEVYYSNHYAEKTGEYMSVIPPEYVDIAYASASGLTVMTYSLDEAFGYGDGIPVAFVAEMEGYHPWFDTGYLTESTARMTVTPSFTPITGDYLDVYVYDFTAASSTSSRVDLEVTYRYKIDEEYENPDGTWTVIDHQTDVPYSRCAFYIAAFSNKSITIDTTSWGGSDASNLSVGKGDYYKNNGGRLYAVQIIAEIGQGVEDGTGHVGTVTLSAGDKVHTIEVYTDVYNFSDGT